ncbi:Alpha/beta hydrolase family protein [Dyella jiangningensis]|uniref:alpha/beta fold hydrolase n=1 Tax=Dyella sp. AtDHG13 TaxID=1938897 RepID=UPI00088578DE|nr:alpha/beta hydrolase [Dyella sp. AtDHG13]PXV61522.1 alpha/beta hydrolase family protein [Dyella sp. AtDHG13]SDJ72844.1 Alpha/beta hydrolase family protein [Dyella jiangningensis]
MFKLHKALLGALLSTLAGTSAHAGSMPATKDIVLVHGAFVDGSGWRAVYDILKKDGYHVTVVQEPLTGLADDIAATRRVIDQQTGPIVLVGHSYAGSIITDAGNDPKVHALVYVAAFQPDAHETIGALVSRFAPPNDAVRATPDGYLYVDPAKFHATVAADVPASATEFLADAQQPVAAAVFATPTTAAAWRTKPSYAILTTQDHAINPDLQRWMYQRSGARVTEVKASHAVYASQPAIVAHVIETAARQSN